MADLDEDNSLPTGTSAPDTDLTEETQDFRFLTHFSHSPSLPRRGEKDFEPHGTASQASILSASRSAMHTALSHPRMRAAKTNIVGSFDARSGETVVESQKGQHFRTMGRADARGRLRLLPEETLYLLERGNLDVRWEGGMVLSLQAAYVQCVGRLGVSLERYTVYAGLRRSGYVVQRGPAWDEEEEEGEVDVVERRGLEVRRRESVYAWMCRLLFETKPQPPPPLGPLVRPGLYRSYNDIYRLLSIIPYHDPTLPTARETQEIVDKPKPVGWDADTVKPSRPHQLRPCFHVWKPRPDFKKSSPGPPDFRIAVLNARESEFPVLEQLDGLLQRVPYEPPPKRIERQTYQKLKHGYRNVILAVVDQGVVSYIRLADAGFGRERLYERQSRDGGKRGGARGGRGRGRGR